jgi:hypothetical protein
LPALWKYRPHETDVGSQHFQRLFREICRKKFRKLLRVTQFMRHAGRMLFPVITSRPWPQNLFLNTENYHGASSSVTISFLNKANNSSSTRSRSVLNFPATRRSTLFYSTIRVPVLIQTSTSATPFLCLSMGRPKSFMPCTNLLLYTVENVKMVEHEEVSLPPLDPLQRLERLRELNNQALIYDAGGMSPRSFGKLRRSFLKSQRRS